MINDMKNTKWLNHNGLDVEMLKKWKVGTGCTFFYFDNSSYILGQYTGQYDKNIIEGYDTNNDKFILEKLDNPNPSKIFIVFSQCGHPAP